jgi:hypothetical protein
MSVESKLKEVGVSSEVRYLFPKKCSFCDLDLELSSDLTSLFCVNPFCRGLYLSRAVNFCEVLGLTQFGYSFFERLIQESTWSSDFISDFYKLDSLDLTFEDVDFETRFLSFKSSVSKLKSTLTLEQYLTSLSLPLIEDIIPKICDRYDSMQDFYSELDIVLDFEGYLTIFGLSLGSEDLIIRYIEVFNIYRKDILGFKVGR